MFGSLISLSRANKSTLLNTSADFGSAAANSRNRRPRCSLWTGTKKSAEFNTLRNQSRQAQTHTDPQREEAQALDPEAQILAVDLCDTVEFFYCKDLDASNRRQKAIRWGVVYLYEPGETPDPAPPPSNP